MFNDRLRAARMARGFTMQQLADAANMALRSYQQYEQGKSEPPFSTLVILANMLKVPLDWLLGRDEYLNSLGVVVDVPKTSPPRRPRPKCPQ